MLEDTWYDQEPRPDPPVYRKAEAANAVAEAGKGVAQQAALTELRAARAEELQAEKEYNALYGLDRAA